LLRSGASLEALKQRMSELIYRKPWGHGLPENVIPVRRVMSQIGG
jgi:cyclic pyranopterin phosphate synthase